MNRNEISQNVSNYYSTASAIVAKDQIFEISSIKAFRVIVKKLKAFFVLLEMETNGVGQFALSRQIHELYINLGYIAKLQFHSEKIKNYCKSASSAAPVFYLKKIQRELNYCKNRIKKLLAISHGFDDEKLINSLIPDELSAASIKKFLQYSSYELQKFYFTHGDESLQSLKKLLEDIFYNWQFLQPYTYLLPGSFSRLEYINGCIAMLSGLHKNTIDIAILRLSDTDLPGEREILKKLQQKLITDSDLLRQNIYTELNREKFDRTGDQSYKALNY